NRRPGPFGPGAASLRSKTSYARLRLDFRARSDQYRERIAYLARTDADGHVVEAGIGQQMVQLALVESEAPVTHLAAYPLFVMGPEIEDQELASGHRDPRSLGNRALRVARVMQRLRKQRDVHGLVPDRQLVELPALPDDVRHATPPRQAARALQHGLGSIDSDHA